MPRKWCEYPGCSTLVDKGMCDDHEESTTRVVSPERRERKRIYDSARWRALRQVILSKYDDVCAQCGALASDIHHKVSLADGGDPWDEDNLEALCKRCHSKETARERKRRL